MPAIIKRSPLEKHKDREEISRLALRGLEIGQIAAKLNNGSRRYELTFGMIKADMKALENNWKEQSKENFAGARAKELDLLWLLNNETWELLDEARNWLDRDGVGEPPSHLVKIISELRALSAERSKLQDLYSNKLELTGDLEFTLDWGEPSQDMYEGEEFTTDEVTQEAPDNLPAELDSEE